MKVIFFSGGITLFILTIKRRLWSLIIRLSWGSVKKKAEVRGFEGVH